MSNEARTAAEQINYSFRKKPILIEAFQMTKERRWDNSEWPNWLCEAWQKEPAEEGCLYCIDDNGLIGPGDRLCISTLEGVYAVTFDDWIIKGVKGELYPCKPDIFEATYAIDASTQPLRDRIAELEAERDASDRMHAECVREVIAERDKCREHAKRLEERKHQLEREYAATLQRADREGLTESQHYARIGSHAVDALATLTDSGVVSDSEETTAEPVRDEILALGRELTAAKAELSDIAAVVMESGQDVTDGLKESVSMLITNLTAKCKQLEGCLPMRQTAKLVLERDTANAKCGRLERGIAKLQSCQMPNDTLNVIAAGKLLELINKLGES